MDLKFDYVIGNPPYHENDGGSGASATPVYNKFIDCVKAMNTDVISMIIPAKWYSGGKGLDQFRKDMLNDPHMAVLVDYTNSADVFPGVDIAGGVCYFVRDVNHNGECFFTNNYNGKATSEYRSLNEFLTFIRYPLATTVVKKIQNRNEPKLDKIVSSRKPFGLPTTVRPMGTGDIKLRYNSGIGYYSRSSISVGEDLIDKWKIIISYLTAEHAGQPDKKGQYRVLSTMEKLEPGYVCSETYLVAGYFDSEEEADNYMKYLKTKFVRFLVLQIAVTQHITKTTFSFVPVQDFTTSSDIDWSQSTTMIDKQLYSKYVLKDEEIAFMEALIKEMT